MQNDNNAACTTADTMFFYQRIGKLTIGKLRSITLFIKWIPTIDIVKFQLEIFNFLRRV